MGGVGGVRALILEQVVGTEVNMAHPTPRAIIFVSPPQLLTRILCSRLILLPRAFLLLASLVRRGSFTDWTPPIAHVRTRGDGDPS